MTPHEEAVFTRDACTRVRPILHKTVGDLMTFEKFDRRAALTLVGLQLALLIEAAQVSLLARRQPAQSRHKSVSSKWPAIFSAMS
jgi:hypothetical protein